MEAYKEDVEKQLRLATQFAKTWWLAGAPPEGWEDARCIIGMHANWLMEEEANAQVLHFSGIADAGYYTHYLRQEANLVRFFLALHALDALLLCQEDSGLFVPVDNVPALLQTVTLGVRELGHYILYSPALHTLFVDAQDVAVVAYTFDKNCVGPAQVTISQLARASNLHVLH